MAPNPATPARVTAIAFACSVAMVVRPLGAVVCGAGVAAALWVLLRPILLGLSPNYILFPRWEDAAQRLFVYTIFGTGAAAAGLLGGRWGVVAAPVAGALAYFVVLSTVQGLWVNPDWWKWWERGYHLRNLEVLALGAGLGWLSARATAWVGRHAPRLRREG